MELCLIYTTFPDREAARAVAQSLLQKKLAACCNILGDVESHYVWQGKQEVANEVIMLCKTTTAAASAAMSHIAAHHPYDTPAILQLPATAADTAFATWVGQFTVPVVGGKK